MKRQRAFYWNFLIYDSLELIGFFIYNLLTGLHTIINSKIFARNYPKVNNTMFNYLNLFNNKLVM